MPLRLVEPREEIVNAMSVQIGWRQATAAILRNQLHRVLGGALRGGHRTMSWSADQRRDHAAGIFATLSPYLGHLKDRTGLEVGPGDNLDVCRLCLDAGCRRMYAVERYARPAEDESRVSLIRSQIEETRLPEEVDFAYSNDVFEHVADVPEAMKAIFKSLRPGGRFVNSIDLRGHNVFNNPRRPLDFLTCPDWLWGLMFSHIVTTNRVRVHEFVQAAEAAGFIVLKSEALATAEEAYLEEILPHLLPLYRVLPNDDLQVLQLLLVLERPTTWGDSNPRIARHVSTSAPLSAAIGLRLSFLWGNDMRSASRSTGTTRNACARPSVRGSWC